VYFIFSYSCVDGVHWKCCLRYAYVFLNSREFTHRVKSISMAKFTSQEVTALKEGGNQVNTLNLSSFDEFFLLAFVI